MAKSRPVFGVWKHAVTTGPGSRSIVAPQTRPMGSGSGVGGDQSSQSDQLSFQANAVIGNQASVS